MEKIATEHPEVFIIVPKKIGDARGWFMETYSEGKFAEIGITDTFVQDNMAFTAQKGTLRGIHFQNRPAVQSKLVRVTRGAVLDLAIDLRRRSENYLKWVTVELTEDNLRMFYIPRGFGHAYLTLSDNVEFCYKVDELYSAESDRSIRFDDPALCIDWGIADPLVSDKDRSAPLLCDSDCNF